MKILFTFKGKVVKGKSRGLRLGFPTANIMLNQKIPEGIYVSYVIVDKISYPAATFVGNPKTFNETDKKAECYILNFDEKIYGKNLTVQLIKKLRENKKFSSEAKLIEQIKQDVENVKEFFEL